MDETIYPIDMNKHTENNIKYFFIFPILKYTYSENKIHDDKIPIVILKSEFKFDKIFIKLNKELKNKVNTNKFLY